VIGFSGARREIFDDLDPARVGFDKVVIGARFEEGGEDGVEIAACQAAHAVFE
jgi:hypothetical protein